MSDVSELKTLGSLAPGVSGTVAEFDKSLAYNDSSMIDRLREMGFSEGLEFEFLHQSPFGKDPIAVRVGAMTIAMRRKDANFIKVQVA